MQQTQYAIHWVPFIVPLPLSMASIAPERARRPYANVTPPFRLAEGRYPRELDETLGPLAKLTDPLALPLAIGVLGGRVVLSLTHPDQALNRLLGGVADAVRPLRAHLPNGLAGTGEVRRPETEPPAIQDHDTAEVSVSGRFHVVLTRRLDLGAAYAAAAALEPVLSRSLPHGHRMSDLVLVARTSGDRWRAVRRYALSGSRTVGADDADRPGKVSRPEGVAASIAA